MVISEQEKRSSLKTIRDIHIYSGSSLIPGA
jgi:hypothetical protein